MRRGLAGDPEEMVRADDSTALGRPSVRSGCPRVVFPLNALKLMESGELPFPGQCGKVNIGYL